MTHRKRQGRCFVGRIFSQDFLAARLTSSVPSNYSPVSSSVPQSPCASRRSLVLWLNQQLPFSYNVSYNFLYLNFSLSMILKHSLFILSISAYKNPQFFLPFYISSSICIFSLSYNYFSTCYLLVACYFYLTILLYDVFNCLYYVFSVIISWYIWFIYFSLPRDSLFMLHKFMFQQDIIELCCYTDLRLLLVDYNRLLRLRFISLVEPLVFIYFLEFLRSLLMYGRIAFMCFESFYFIYLDLLSYSYFHYLCRDFTPFYFENITGFY